MQKLLITGGSGLLALNWAIHRRTESEVFLLLHKRYIALKGVSYCNFELSNKENIETNLLRIQPDLVIHTAGLTDVDQCEAIPKNTYNTNVVLSGNIAEICQKLDCKLVHISTDHLFDGFQSFRREEDEVSPLNEYARSKALAEKVVLGKNNDALIIRTNIFGWGTSYRTSFSDFIISNLRDKKAITLFTDVHYTPILIADLVDQIESLINNKASGIFNVPGKERLSKYEFGKLICKTFNLDSRYIIPSLISQKHELVHRPNDMSLSGEKTMKLTGRELSSIKQGIQRLYHQEKLGTAKELKAL